MKDFAYREIWLPIDVNGDTDARALTGNSPMIYKGAECVFRLALYDRLPLSEENPGEFRNHQNIVAFLLSIKTGSYAGTEVLNTGWFDGLVLDAAATEAQFITKQRAPISIHVPGSYTAALTAGEHYLTFSGRTNESTEPDGFGFGRVTVKDIGITTAAAPAPEVAGSYITAEMFNAAIGQCVKFGKNPAGKTFTLVSRSGAFGRTHGCDDAGSSVDRKETY